GAMYENDRGPTVHFARSLRRVVGRPVWAGPASLHSARSCDLKAAREVWGMLVGRSGMPTVPAREFHGRDAELALIRGELEHLSDGAEAVVVVEGAAGMGKSRLLAEAAAIASS